MQHDELLYFCVNCLLPTEARHLMEIMTLLHATRMVTGWLVHFYIFLTKAHNINKVQVNTQVKVEEGMIVLGVHDNGSMPHCILHPL